VSALVAVRLNVAADALTDIRRVDLDYTKADYLAEHPPSGWVRRERRKWPRRTSGYSSCRAPRKPAHLGTDLGTKLCETARNQCDRARSV